MNTNSQYFRRTRKTLVILSLLFTLFMITPENHNKITQTFISSIKIDSKSAKSQSTSNPPTIEWPTRSDNITEPIVICWDGIYTGQIEETWTWSVDVNDSDGVDTVLFRFQYTNSNEWFNKSAVRIEGDEIQGKYEVTLTWGVTWNSQYESPMWVNGSGNFWFKVWANDTIRNWNETEPILYIGGYLAIYTPTTPTSPISPPFGLYIIGGASCFSIAVFVTLLIIKRKKNDK